VDHREEARMSVSPDLLVFKNITKRFPGVTALDDVSFSIDKAEIHAIVGENGAGKSTLMNILGGEIQPDGGQVIIDGSPVVLPTPYASRRRGISIVYQELKLCPNLTVVENLFLGREKEGDGGRLNWRRLAGEAAKTLESIGANVSPRELVSRLSIAEQQQVEIAKAISMNAWLIIMDEPTSALTHRETAQLFKNLFFLRDQKQVTIIFISHRLEEVFEISERITVLRDGKYLGTQVTKDTRPDEIVSLIAGRQLASELKNTHGQRGKSARTVLEVKNLSRGRHVKNVDFALQEKEILGIYGLQGAGRTELLETIFGIHRPESGEIIVNGKSTVIPNPKAAIRNGIAMIPEDRRRVGLFSNFSVKDNVGVAILEDVNVLGFIRFGHIVEIARQFIKSIGIKLNDVAQIIGSLSGGNQQKVIIARWLATKPKIFLMDEPTRGIDVGAKVEIFSILRGLRDEGLSILLVSSELEEVISESDRLLVMRNGKIVANLVDQDINKETVLRYAMQG
jgi:ABC-type sugar transport system ATPase subunit